MKRILCLQLCPTAGTSPGRSGPPGVVAAEKLLQLAQWCRQFSPTVGAAPDALPDCLFLDLTGIAHLFGDEPRLTQMLSRQLIAQGFRARIAIADTLGAAWALAWYGREAAEAQRHKGTESAIDVASRQETRLCASVPLSLCSSHLIPPGQTLPALRPLPIAALRIDEATLGVLRRLGIFTLAQLEALPREDLSARFGPQLLNRWDQALGLASEPLPGVPLLPDFQAEQHWEYPVRRRDAVNQAVESLLEQICQTLRTHGRGALRVACRLSGADQEPHEFSVGLFRATAAARRLWALLAMQLEAFTFRGPVTAVRVTVVATAPLVERQQELFPELPQRCAPRQLEELLERLTSRLGSQAVLRARLRPDAQPEWACVYEPLIGREVRRRPRLLGATASEVPPRPWRLLRRPLPIDVLAVLPDGPPARAHLAGHTQPIGRSWGPERIETGWWRSRPAARDYYRVETASGTQFWLFRRLTDGRWFWHGEF